MTYYLDRKDPSFESKMHDVLVVYKQVSLLKKLDEKYPAQDTIRLVLDNHSAHTLKETQKYLATRQGRFEFVVTPKHGSWLNLIESFFGKMAKQCLKGIRVDSKEERIYQYIA